MQISVNKKINFITGETHGYYQYSNSHNKMKILAPAEITKHHIRNRRFTMVYKIGKLKLIAHKNFVTKCLHLKFQFSILILTFLALQTHQKN